MSTVLIFTPKTLNSLFPHVFDGGPCACFRFLDLCCAFEYSVILTSFEICVDLPTTCYFICAFLYHIVDREAKSALFSSGAGGRDDRSFERVDQ